MSKVSAIELNEMRGAVPLFVALGDETRLQLLAMLSSAGPASITRLSTTFPMSRQAITKHLLVLSSAGLVTGKRRGRERVWEFHAEPLAEAGAYLNRISQQWDETLTRLKKFAED